MANTTVQKNYISYMDRDTDDEVLIEHPKAVTLDGGFYVVKDFKKIPCNKRSIKKRLDAGKTVYYLNAYCGNGPDEDAQLVFTGEVIWKNEEYYEISSCGGGGLNLGVVPAGTLVMGMSDD